MNATRTQYSSQNTTSMSDDAYYGREPALNVDLDACRRAAVQESRDGLNKIIGGNADAGRWMIRRAVYRLALAVGNQSEAEAYLRSACMPALPDYRLSDAEKADRAELDAAAARQHPHPELLAALQAAERQLAEARK